MHNKLKTARQRLKYSQEDVARLCGISLRQYQNIEHGKCQPRIHVGLRLALILKCDPYYLFSTELDHKE